jgi:hypothetical protein
MGPHSRWDDPCEDVERDHGELTTVDEMTKANVEAPRELGINGPTGPVGACDCLCDQITHFPCSGLMSLNEAESNV